MAFDDTKKTRGLGEPIPLAVIDVANETIDVPQQKLPDPEQQLSALRIELDALRTKIERAENGASKVAKTARHETVSMISDYPVAAAALVGSLLLVVLAARSNHRTPSPIGRYREILSGLRDRIEQGI